MLMHVSFYNSTHHSGLETDIADAYTNALFQAIHYVPFLRRLAITHTDLSCHKEHCLLCETGFLSRMLLDGKGINCQANNLARAIGNQPQGEFLAVCALR